MTLIASFLLPAQEKCLLEVKGQGLREDQAEGVEEEADNADPVLLIHPECNMADLA